MNTGSKLSLGSLIGVASLTASKVFAQADSQPLLPSVIPDTNIASASIHQLLNNPASLTVIPFLCVIAWLCDDLPFIKSRYVSHITVIVGGSIYWLFAGPTSVPKSFPYPEAVLVVNGVMCGFFAFLVHRQAIARIINAVRAKTGGEPLSSNSNQTSTKPNP